MVQFNEADGKIEKPNKCSCKCRIIAAVMLLVLLAGVVCWHVHRPQPAVPENSEMDMRPRLYCTVQFRRDVLGTARDMPISPETTGINNSMVSMRGHLIAIDQEAILLEHYVERTNVWRRYWIPKSNILHIEYDQPDSQ